MKEIKVQLKHAQIDAPLECTMKLNDEFFFVDNYHFAPIIIHEERYIPVEMKYYNLMCGFLRTHHKEWQEYIKKAKFDPTNNKVYDLIRANNVREWQNKESKTK